MNDIDEILASGRYTDRRGREWARRLFLRPNIRWANIIRDEYLPGIGWPGEKISDAQMRLLIERDHHRDECPRVGVCRNHPVPRVTFCDVGGFDIWAAGELTRAEFERPCIATRAEAMDAARALVVGE